jgi:hypothetical protein
VHDGLAEHLLDVEARTFCTERSGADGDRGDAVGSRAQACQLHGSRRRTLRLPKPADAAATERAADDRGAAAGQKLPSPDGLLHGVAVISPRSAVRSIPHQM